MWSLFKLVLMLGFLAAFAWFGYSVPLGKATLFGHFARIWHTRETQDLIEGTKERAEPAIREIKRSVEPTPAEGKR